MGQYSGINSFEENIYQFEETDLVLAATDNIPLQQLANRTTWLKNRLDSQFTSERLITANYTISNDDRGCFYRVNSTGVINVQLPDVALVPNGAIYPFYSYCVIAGAINIKSKTGQPIYDSDGNTEVIYMHHKEVLWLAAFTNHWQVVNAFGNFYCAGEEVKARKERINTIALKGQILNREQYPRLWKFAQSLTMNQEIVSESTWNYDAFTYRGCFSTGDGLTTFRLPDERSMHERMLDLGRGISYARAHNYPGGYEADNIKAHTHSVALKLTSMKHDGWDDISISGNNYNVNTSSAGGAENTVKNIGKLHLIKY